MKNRRNFLLPLMLGVLFAACQPKNGGHNNATPGLLGDPHPFSEPLPVDSANRMIKSYLAGNSAQDSALQSLIFDADTLMNYLADTTKGKIRKVKFMLAHNLSYINGGNFGHNAGYKNNALTLVIVGVDSNGNYVYNARNMVFDYCAPCPYNCPSGNAGGDTLVTIN